MRTRPVVVSILPLQEMQLKRLTQMAKQQHEGMQKMQAQQQEVCSGGFGAAFVCPRTSRTLQRQQCPLLSAVSQQMKQMQQQLVRTFSNNAHTPAIAYRRTPPHTPSPPNTPKRAHAAGRDVWGYAGRHDTGWHAWAYGGRCG